MWRERRRREHSAPSLCQPDGDAACDEGEDERRDPVLIVRQPLVADEQNDTREERQRAEQEQNAADCDEAGAARRGTGGAAELEPSESDFTAHQRGAPLREI